MTREHIGAGRRRVPLDQLMEQWRSGTKTRKTSIRKHWPRSVRAMLAAMLAEHPDEPVRVMPLERVFTKFDTEIMIWWSEPFGPDGVPIMVHLLPGTTTRVSSEQLVEGIINMGLADATMGFDVKVNQSLNRACRQQISLIAWSTAWQERHRSGNGSNRPEVPSVEDARKPNSHWLKEDYEHIMNWEVFSIRCRLRNAEWCRTNNVLYTPVPMEDVFHYPLLNKVFSGEETIPAPPPGQAPLKLPVGPNGRKLVREIVADENDNLGCYLREQTEEEAAEEAQKTSWWICSWYDPPGKVSPREFMRPYLEGTENEHLLERYRDHLVQYDPPT